MTAWTHDTDRSVMPTPEEHGITCDMREGCAEPVAMIDTAGFVYCEGHGLDRRQWEPCRRLRGWELRRLGRGKPLTNY